MDNKDKKIIVTIVGCGQYLNLIEECLNDWVVIDCYFDNDENTKGRTINGRSVYSPYDHREIQSDYLIISAFDYLGLYVQLKEIGYSEDMIIPFFDVNIDFSEYKDVFDVLKSIQASNRCQIIRLKQKYDAKFEYIYRNGVYENLDYYQRHNIVIPQIRGIDETVDAIVEKRCSVSRYGDGEFEIVAGHGGKDVYQEHDEGLAVRLREILLSNLEGHIVALADDYGCMEGLSELAKDNIREYMTPEKREEHYKYIDLNKIYYNAYISRPYVIYPWDDRKGAGDRFGNLKRIWNGQDVVFVEGDKTRSGVGNDLFANARSVRRILCPSEHAYRAYDRILDVTKKLEKNTVILIALGPTASVLAYDLAKEGYWAIDIGHLDLEYEWFLRGNGFSYVRNKYNNELKGDTITIDETDEMYLKSIIERVD